MLIQLQTTGKHMACCMKSGLFGREICNIMIECIIYDVVHDSDDLKS